jgi:hypothetical protein
MYKMHHSKAEIDRLYIKKERRRDLLQIEETYKAETNYIAEYLNTNYKGDKLLNTLKNTKEINQI